MYHEIANGPSVRLVPRPNVHLASITHFQITCRSSAVLNEYLMDKTS